MHDQTTPTTGPDGQEPIAADATQKLSDLAVEPNLSVHEAPAQEQTPFHQQPAFQQSLEPVVTKKRGSGILVGISIGAVVGALIGGATGAVVTSNLANQSQTNSAYSPRVISSTGGESNVAAIAEAATQSVVTIEASSRNSFGTGSGVIYSSDGYIITNAHVVTAEGSSFAETSVRVFMSDGRIYPATIVGTAPYADIAVIKIDEQNLPAINVADSEQILVGDLAVAIGAPFNLSNTVTSGVVSTVYRGIAVGSPLIPEDGSQRENGNTPWNFNFDIPGQESAPVGQVTLPVIQTDADINPGNSGGALLNDKGELIGINVAIASTGSDEQRAGSVGLGFAIPSTLAVRMADSIIEGKKVTHGLLGATVRDSRGADTSTMRGGMIDELSPGGAAEKSGLQSGDIIVSINGVPTPDGTSVSAMVRYFESGTEVEVGLQRGGELIYQDVILGSLT